MLETMCLELSQADLKAIGQSRGFESETINSPELFKHLFFSEQGLRQALATLTETETLGLHLLSLLGEAVELDFFKRLYPGLVPSGYARSFTESHKALFQKVKAQLIRRGILLFGAEPKGIQNHSVLERTRFVFPGEFIPLLPTPFQARQLDAATEGKCRREILRDKLAEILQLEFESSASPAGTERGRWRLENGELLLGGQPFRLNRLEDWQTAQFEAAVPNTPKGQPKALQPVPLLLYALSRLQAEEWLDADALLPLWKLALPGAKTVEPRTVCEAGYEWGCLEKVEVEGVALYRLPRRTDPEAGTQPEAHLNVQNSERVELQLQCAPLAALDRLCEISRLKTENGGLWAEPDFVKISHAPAETLANPLVGWLKLHHAGFRSVMERVEQRKGKLIVHENLLVARISDLGLKVMLEKNFAEPGKLVPLSSEFVAFPKGLLPELQSWMKKSGHVIKSTHADESR